MPTFSSPTPVNAAAGTAMSVVMLSETISFGSTVQKVCVIMSIMGLKKTHVNMQMQKPEFAIESVHTKTF